MPWITPSLREVRSMTRDNVSTALSGASMVANSVLRVMSDAMSALAHLTLLYIDWISLQLLPDTAETEWLDRHGNIWLINSDNSIGRKVSTFAEGQITMTGTVGTIVPAGTRLAGPNAVEYETLSEVILAADETPVEVRALDGGVVGNLDVNESISLVNAISGVDASGTVVSLTGGADEENDDDLRMRVLKRIQEPPMGGCKTDYEEWALAVPGVTRAWSYPNEMGVGTVTIRFLCDDLRWEDNGIPNDDDIEAVTAYIDTVRPVAIKDFFCVAPIIYYIDLTIRNLENDDAAVREAIKDAMLTMLDRRAKPGQTIYRSWVGEAISVATGEDYHDLEFENAVMPGNGYMPILGSISYV